MSREVNSKFAWSLILAAIIFFFMAYNYRDPIKDWWYFRSYSPASEIDSLADEAGMSDHGERLFFRADPQLVPKSTIENQCLGDHNLGCIITGPQIFVLDYGSESNPEFDQAVVTAAHEMLHLAYFRLDESERSRVDKLISQEMRSIKDRGVLARINSYASDEINDEAHSIVATEVDEISNELENYYSQYFSDRSEVIEAYKSSSRLLN